MKKNILRFVILLSLSCLFLVPVKADAAAEWTFGELNASIDDNGLLIISGEGDMLSNDYTHYAPWHHSTYVKEVIICEGVTGIGTYGFIKCSNLKTVTIADSVTTINANAFGDVRVLENVYLGKGITKIANNAFYSYYDKIKTVYYAGSEEDRQKIDFTSGNDDLINANWIYNYKPAEANITDAVSGKNSLKFISEINVNDKDRVKAFGTTFIPLWLFNEGSTDVATVEYDNAEYSIENGQTFGATLTNIPNEFENAEIVGKSFVRGITGNYIWSAAKTASVNNTELVDVE